MSRTPRPTDEQIEAMLERASVLHSEADDKDKRLDTAYYNGVLTALGVVLGYEEYGALFGDASN
tara:strand:- start:1057 stop:1248 length:192 start_codon:yes stop_codon:yes gene_type:complete